MSIVDRSCIDAAANDPNFYTDPWRHYRHWHQRGGPLYWRHYDLWCVFGFDTVDACLRDRRLARCHPHRNPAHATWPAHMRDFARVEEASLLSNEPPRHTRLRRRVQPGFIARRLQPLAPVIETLAHRAIDRFELHGKAELLADYATPLALQTIVHIMGLEPSEGPRLLGWSHAMVKAYTRTQNRAEELTANRAAKAFHAFLLEQIAQRRRQPDQGLLCELISPTADGSCLEDDEIVSLTVLLLNAGHEATVHQMGNGIARLLHEPVAPASWFSSSDSTRRTVDECLRIVPPLHLFTRFAQCDMTLAPGIELKAGDEIGLLLGAANHDPERFSEPARFNPDRSDAGQLALGAGLHHCVGAALARLELQIGLRVLFERLPGLRLAQPPEVRNSFHFHGLAGLRVTFPVPATAST